jgi:phosphodiesterase/alkaline phosphatase D-like protein
MSVQTRSSRNQTDDYITFSQQKKDNKTTSIFKKIALATKKTFQEVMPLQTDKTPKAPSIDEEMYSEYCYKV